jgi:6-phosphogluconate dehydrogenase
MNKEKIGFIGTGWIGSNYADNFESRGFKVIRYSKEKSILVTKRS